MTTSITTIYVTYNSQGTIGDALRAGRSAHEAGLLDCVVVDNASRDGTIECVRREHPWVTLVASPENLGYGRGLNLGMKHATTPYVLFMNPDAVLPAGDLARLVDFMGSHPNAGLIAPAIIEGEIDLQAAGVLPTPWKILAAAAGIPGRRSQRPIIPGQPPFRTDWLCGAVLMSRTQLMREMGGFDPRFFLYFEETDLCRRILRRGLELWAVGTAVARHVGGASAKTVDKGLVGGCLSEHYFRSRYYYMAKHHGHAAATLAEVGELAILVGHAALRGLKGEKYRMLRARLQAPILSFPPGVSA